MKKTVTTIEILKHALRSLRCERGLSQERLGVFLGVNQRRISQIETNPGSIRVSRLLALLRQLNATLAIHYTPEPPNPESEPKMPIQERGSAACAPHHMIVTITKLAVAPDAQHAAAAWTEITPGLPTPNGKSLPVDYEIQGELAAPILPSRPLMALRFRRNGVDALGVFHSSEVREIHVLTHNSVYRITAA